MVDGVVLILAGLIGVLGVACAVLWSRLNRAQSRRAELVDEARAAQRRARDLLQGFEKTPAGVAVMDERLRYVAVNANYAKVFGVPGDGIRDGMTLHEVVRYLAQHGVYGEGDPDELMRERVRYVIDGWQDHDFRLPDGRILNVSYNQADAGYHVALIKDVTSERQNQVLAEQGLKRLRAAIDSLPSGILMLDADLNYLVHNEKYLELMGLPHETVLELGSLPNVIKHQFDNGYYTDHETPEEALDYALELYRKGEPWGYERHWLSQNRHVLIRGNPIPDGGWVLALTDISDQKQAEIALRQAKEDAEAANRAKSTFLATMSHEIRTPMNGVKTMADLLARSDVTKEQREMISIIRQSSDALLAIINDILDFSKIEAGHMEVENISFDPRRAVEDAMQLVAANADDKGLGLDLFIDPVIPDRLLGDPIRVSQVLFNLVGNAVKFTEKGRVEVRVRPSDTAAAIPAKIGLRFDVSDTGIGMTQDQQDRVFTAFQQADQSTTRRFGGTGLGLAISNRLVEIMGGQIHLVSQYGQGSCFSFELAFGQVEFEAAGITGTDLSGLTVGVISDEVPFHENLAGYLTHADVSVERASALEDAREADCIVLDLRAEAVDQVLSFADEVEARELSVILAVTPSILAQLDSELTERFFAILLKPLRFDDVCFKIAAACGRATLDPADEGDALPLDGYAPPPREVARTAGGLVLVAEDHPLNRSLMTELMRCMGYAVDFAENGDQALEMLGTGDYGLLLTDCHMPGMDGYDLAREVRRREDGTENHLPVIALTADAIAGSRELCLASGMDDCLSKPVDIQALDAAIAAYLPVAHGLRREVAASIVPLPEALSLAAERFSDDDILDIASLRGFPGGLDGTVRDVVHKLPGRSRGLEADLKAAMERQDWPEVKFLAHAGKGAALFCGASQLGNLFADIERHADRRAAEPAERSIQAISVAVTNFETALTALYGDSLSA